MNNYFSFLLLVSILGMSYAYAEYENKKPIDSTDPPDGRSGMHLYIDNKTGCHYLSNGYPLKWLPSQIIPRMDKTGKQVCDGREDEEDEEDE